MLRLALGSQGLSAKAQKGCCDRKTAACRRCSLGFGRGVFCSFGVGQGGAMWGGCQNKLSAFLRSACNSLFFNALKSQKKCAEMYEGQTKPTWPSRVQASRRKAILYPFRAGRRPEPALQRPSRSSSGAASWLRPHCDPDDPQKNDESDERDERDADGIGVCQDHRFSSSRRKMPSQFSFVLK